MKRLPLSIQIVGWFVLLFGALFLLLLLGMFVHVRVTMHDQIDRDLHLMARRIEDRLLHAGEDPDSLLGALLTASELLAPARNVTVLRDGRVLVRSGVVLPEVLNGTQSQQWEAWTHDDGILSYRVVVHRGEHYTVAIAENISFTEHFVTDAFGFVAFSVPLVVLLSVVAGFFLVRRLLQPIDVISHKARQISSTNLNERIPLPQSDDEIRRMVETLNGMIERLEAGFRRMEQFTANASHELRTPLTVMKGELEVTLQHPRGIEEYRDILASNLEEVTRISRTVDSLFLLARMDSRELRITNERVDLPALLEEIHSEACRLASEKQITVSLDAGSPCHIQGDFVLLTQLFLNLLDNAVKYSGNGGTIHMSVHGKSRSVLISVKDSGIGIPAGEIPLIFDRFYRVNKNRSRLLGGAGLGLSIAKWIVDMHRGEITVQSIPGEGSTFTVALPRDPADR